MKNNQLRKLFDFLKKPVLTEKTTKFLEQKQYTFEIDVQLTKTQIKQIFEQYYNTKIKSIKTNRINSKAQKWSTKRVRIHFLDNISFLPE